MADDARPQPPRIAGGPTAEGIVRSADLLAGRKQLLIDHQGQIYRLLLTKNGKLILQK